MMNKKYFVNALIDSIGVSEKEAIEINYILEENNILGKKAKENIIDIFMEKLKVDGNRVNEIYNTSMEIIKNSIKEKLKHPFKSID